MLNNDTEIKLSKQLKASRLRALKCTNDSNLDIKEIGTSPELVEKMCFIEEYKVFEAWDRSKLNTGELTKTTLSHSAMVIIKHCDGYMAKIIKGIEWNKGHMYIKAVDKFICSLRAVDRLCLRLFSFFELIRQRIFGTGR